jgi:hypothetical protein
MREFSWRMRSWTRWQHLGKCTMRLCLTTHYSLDRVLDECERVCDADFVAWVEELLRKVPGRPVELLTSSSGENSLSRCSISCSFPFTLRRRSGAQSIMLPPASYNAYRIELHTVISPAKYAAKLAAGLKRRVGKLCYDANKRCLLLGSFVWPNAKYSMLGMGGRRYKTASRPLLQVPQICVILKVSVITLIVLVGHS